MNRLRGICGNVERWCMRCGRGCPKIVVLVVDVAQMYEQAKKEGIAEAVDLSVSRAEERGWVSVIGFPRQRLFG